MMNSSSCWWKAFLELYSETLCALSMQSELTYPQRIVPYPPISRHTH